MKAFTSVLLISASAAIASAQATYNDTTGMFQCAQPNVAYCAGDSLSTNIIIRCNADGVGQPGNCDDNLDGEPPQGINESPCYQTSPTKGDAACSKNCIVYGNNGTFTLPAALCTPSGTSTSAPGTGVPPSPSSGAGAGYGGNATSVAPPMGSGTGVPIAPTGTSTSSPGMETGNAGANIRAGVSLVAVGVFAGLFL